MLYKLEKNCVSFCDFRGLIKPFILELIESAILAELRNRQGKNRLLHHQTNRLVPSLRFQVLSYNNYEPGTKKIDKIFLEER